MMAPKMIDQFYLYFYFGNSGIWSDPQDKMRSGRELFSCYLYNSLFPPVISALRANPVVQDRRSAIWTQPNCRSYRFIMGPSLISPGSGDFVFRMWHNLVFTINDLRITIELKIYDSRFELYFLFFNLANTSHLGSGPDDVERSSSRWMIPASHVFSPSSFSGCTLRTGRDKWIYS